MASSEHLRLANDSGFPLQIAVQGAVGSARSRHDWRVRFSEHSWSNSTDGSSGFIDLVVENQAAVVKLVVECKRVRDSTWLFLEPSGVAPPVARAKAWISSYQGGRFAFFGWHDVAVAPLSPEAMFCAVRGQSTSERLTLLERTGAEVVSATEAVAAELRDFRPDFPSNFQIYFNVIVTTADLVVARFDPAGLSVADGTLAGAEFTAVPYVRLRKQLSRRPFAFGIKAYQRNLDPAEEKANSVFVVSSSAFSQFLSEFDVSNYDLRQFFVT